MDISKIQFGELAQTKGIDKTFEDLDINNDGKINSADESIATDTEVKSAIQNIINSVDEEECVTIVDDDFDANNFAKNISNEQKIYKENGGDFNGDGKITYDDVEYIANKYNFAEVEKAARKISNKCHSSRNSITDSEWKLYQTYTDYRILINAVKGKSDKEIEKKIKNTANGKTDKGITISDMIAYYDKVSSMSDSAFKAMFGTGTGYSNILKEMTTALSTSASTANATPEELSRLKEIYSELSSGTGKLADILKRTMRVSDKSSEAMAKRLSGTWGKVFESVISNAENNKDIVDKISSQLQCGDIPEGKSVTFNLDSGEKFVKSPDEYIDMKKASFESALYKKRDWDDSFKFDDLKFNVSSAGVVTATCYYKGKCVYSGSSEPYSEYKSRMNSQNLVTIANIGGKYMYSIADTTETAIGQQNIGNLNITDAQIDAVMRALKGTGILNSIYSGHNATNDRTIFDKILSVLNASQIGTSTDYTFTNELGYSSKIWTCDCVGKEYLLVEKFVKIINAKLLFESAKNQSPAEN